MTKKINRLAVLASALLMSPLAGFAQSGTGGAAPGGASGTQGSAGATGTTGTDVNGTGVRSGTDGATTGSGQSQGAGTQTQGVTGDGTSSGATQERGATRHHRPHSRAHANDDATPSGVTPNDSSGSPIDNSNGGSMSNPGNSTNPNMK